jgi:hypothetical protein
MTKPDSDITATKAPVEWDAATYDCIEQLPPTAHRAFLRAVMHQLGEPVIDYFRLNIEARRAIEPR